MMKSQIKQKARVIALAALCVWSTQAASAYQGSDAIFNCKIYSKNAAGTAFYYLRQINEPGKSGTLVYTTDNSLATVFTFSRRNYWKDDTGGTTYFMTGGLYGGCVGLDGNVTPAVKTLVATNWSCVDSGNLKVVIKNLSTTVFTMRFEKYPGYYFSGANGLINGANIWLNVPLDGGAYATNQRFYTTGCMTATGARNRMRGGT
jgi:hypothetical protein